MDIFQYFDAGNRRIEEQLREILRNGHCWSNQILFDRISHVFSEIKEHCELQEHLVQSMSRHGNRQTVETCLADRKGITEQMDNLLMSHIDDEDFRPGLRKLLTKMEQHITTSHDKLFSEAKIAIPADEIEEMNSRILEKLFS